METERSTNVHLYRETFKSYYVVWKPIFPDMSWDRRCEFKSYYVVWKPKRASAVPAPIAMFKSYYVVWKLIFSPSQSTTYRCLNRTM